MNHLTLGHLTVNVGPVETIEAAAASGFKSVSLRAQGRRKSDDFQGFVGYPDRVREVGRRLADTWLRLSSIQPYVFYDEIGPDDIARLAETALELKPQFIVCNDYLADGAAFLGLIEPLAEAVSDGGIVLAIEFLKFSECKSLGAAIDLIEKSRLPNIRVLVDSLHLDRSGGTNAEVAALDPRQIAFLQINDAMRRTDNPTSEMLIEESRSARLEPGEGELDLYGLLDALPRDIEIEYEVTNARYRNMTAVERARHAHCEFRRFLDAYATSRGFAYDW